MDNFKTDLITDEVSGEIIAIVEKIAKEEGAHNVSVSKVLSQLGVTNRVFYNRFRNIDEVLEIVYRNAVFKMRESLKSEYDISKDFFEYIMDVAVKVLINTYEIKMDFNRYMFEHDSLTQENFNWWTEKVKKLIEYAKEQNLIKDVDSDMLSYSIWCFCRGYNADAVSRKLSLEEAIKNFKFGFGCLIDGVKIKQRY